MLTILMGRAKTGKSDTVLRRIAALGESGRQILLVPEHASHQAEVDVCRACGDHRQPSCGGFELPPPERPGAQSDYRRQRAGDAGQPAESC